jgi:hypothetical protein
MISRLRQLLIIGTVGAVFAGAAVAPVGAIELFDNCKGSNKDTAVCEAANNDDATSTAQSIINTLLLIIGIVAVIVIVLGGFRYVTSNGDQNSITAAKNTILYAVIGLIVAIMASLIVNVVLAQFI